MTTETDDLAARLRAELHHDLDALPVAEASWAQTRASIDARRRRALRHRLVTATAVLATAGAVAAVVVLTVPGDKAVHLPIVPDRPSSFAVLGNAKLPGTAATPAPIAVGSGSVFAAVRDTGRLVRLDATTLRQTGSLRIGGSGGGPIDVAYGGGAVWVLDALHEQLWRVDPATMTVTWKTFLGAEPSRVGYGDGWAWVTVCCTSTDHDTRQRLLRIDPISGHISRSLAVGGDGNVVNLAIGPQVMVGSQTAPAIGVDPATVTALPRLAFGCNGCPGVPSFAAGPDGVYLTMTTAVRRFDPATMRFAALSPQFAFRAQHPPTLALGPDGLWLTTGGELVRLDPSTLVVTGRVAVAGASHVAVAGGEAYVTYPGGIDRVGAIVLDSTRTLTATAYCTAALPGVVGGASYTTVGAIRSANFGGPPPGIVPGRHAFPGTAPGARAAWCWTLDTSPSPGSQHDVWDLYAVTAWAPPMRLFTMDGLTRPPTGPPSIP